MTTWAILENQKVWIASRTVAFTVVCEQCARLGEAFPSVVARLELETFRATIECRNGHRLRARRAGR